MAITKYMQVMLVDTQASLPASADMGQVAFCQDTKISLIFDGTIWQPSDKLVVKKSTVVVNGKNIGVTPIYTLEPSSLNFYPTQIIMRAVNVSGATLKPTVSIGSNASSYDNIATGSLLNSLLTLTGASTSPQNVSTSAPLSGGTVINANVSLGALAVNYTFTVNVIGFYA
ncbi:hypothetical protein DFR67_114163 [Williamsia limnetica]|uniref:Uncharacterized protein n=1 Tax=Williamsia limnetica TaxID=882452 RepID=A0A318RH29_WILLI|nr:hypothetical protein [Williamsia limnetica]PYE14064.1 hypothetical protein DFR67_114163 [Williamsia limnetica]